MKSALLLFAALLPAWAAAQAPADCAASIAQLRALAGDAAFPLKWQETSMGDGKPLVVSIAEGNATLVLEFVKTGEGLWAASTGVVCKAGAELEARFAADHVRLGPAANWLVRGSLANGGIFKLTRIAPGQQLRISTMGWSGSFVPHDR